MDQRANLSQTSTCAHDSESMAGGMATLNLADSRSAATSSEHLVQNELDLADNPLSSNLPEPPEEPLQSDCCGTGCSPCVFDIYQEDLARWKELSSLTPEQRAARLLNPSPRTKPVKARAALSPHEYRTFDVVALKQVSSDSFIYTFRLPEGCILGTGIGQHAVLRVCGERDEKLTRQYTPISEPDRMGSFDVLIKVYEKGQMSAHIREWTIGSKAHWRGPFGNFTYQPNQFRHIAMLACGTGIAPMVNIAHAVVGNDDEDTTIHCIFACRTQHDILLKEQLDHFKSYWNFNIAYALSRSSMDSLASDPGKVRYGDTVYHGRVDRKLVEKEMPGFLPPSNDKSMVLICGTKSFTKDMINLLLKMGCSRESYFKF